MATFQHITISIRTTLTYKELFWTKCIQILAARVFLVVSEIVYTHKKIYSMEPDKSLRKKIIWIWTKFLHNFGFLVISREARGVTFNLAEIDGAVGALTSSWRSAGVPRLTHWNLRISAMERDGYTRYTPEN